MNVSNALIAINSEVDLIVRKKKRRFQIHIQYRNGVLYPITLNMGRNR